MKWGLVLPVAATAVALSAASGRASSPSPIVFAADRAPTVSGEIYRLDPNGRRVDLSRSPYQDTAPAISSDGKRVAFFSDRGGAWAVYEVGSNGKGLRRLGPAADVQEGGGQLTWQPQGRLVAVSTSGRVWIDAAGHKPVLVKRKGFYTGPWSPDGRVLLLTTRSEVDAVTPGGRELWHANGWGGNRASAWSPQGLLAISADHGAAVYDESGHLRLRFGLPTTFPFFSWSPDGRHLAVAWSGTKYQQLEVRTSDGSLVLEGHVPGGDLGWAGNFKVVAGACSTCRSVGADIRTGKLSPASGRWLDPISPDRQLAIVTPPRKSGFSLGVARPGGGPVKSYREIAGCSGDGVWLPAATSLQFVGPTRSIVYQSGNYCDEPFANLYSVGADGSGLHRLTNARAEETQPAVSPDGGQIAYVWAQLTGLGCKGCSDGIRVINADGTGARTLTNPENCTFDDSPTWSPDGNTILYSEDACSSPGELYTIPASGGTPHDLGIAGSEPAWGPSQIAYLGSESSDGGLWTANPDGSDPIRVAQQGELPAWSPDGRLAYLHGTTLVVGSTQAALPFARVTSLGWSPDGTRLVVTASKTKLGPLDVYTIKADGTDPIRLTKNYGASGVSGR